MRASTWPCASAADGSSRRSHRQAVREPVSWQERPGHRSSDQASRSCSTRAAIASTAAWSSPATSTVSPLPGAEGHDHQRGAGVDPVDGDVGPELAGLLGDDRGGSGVQADGGADDDRLAGHGSPWVRAWWWCRTSVGQTVARSVSALLVLFRAMTSAAPAARRPPGR